MNWNGRLALFLVLVASNIGSGCCAASPVAKRAGFLAGRPPGGSVQREVLVAGLARQIAGGVREKGEGGATFACKRPGLRGRKEMMVYRKYAPAVVLILADQGRSIGSGFVIDKDGWILTNHHVVEGGRLNDEMQREVTVMFGQLGEFRQMEVIEKRFAAQVYAWDEVRDVALLKVAESADTARILAAVNPIKVSEYGPETGLDVLAIGHAKATFMWSLKPGLIQGMGRFGANVPQVMAMWEQRLSTRADHSSLGDVRAKVGALLKERAQVAYVQATAPILPGDSGGPLLDEEGELVGMNAFLRKDDASGSTVQYFIHPREFTNYVALRPAKPMVFLPAPSETGADSVELYDDDEDGRKESAGFTRTEMQDDEEVLNTRAMAWDVAGRNAPNTKAGAFAYQIYCLMLEQGRVAMAYDLDEDGFFERVRIGDGNSGVCQVELVAEKQGGAYAARRLKGRQAIVLKPSELSESWRKSYQDVVLAVCRQPEGAE